MIQKALIFMLLNFYRQGKQKHQLNIIKTYEQYVRRIYKIDKDWSKSKIAKLMNQFFKFLMRISKAQFNQIKQNVTRKPIEIFQYAKKYIQPYSDLLVKFKYVVDRLDKSDYSADLNVQKVIIRAKAFSQQALYNKFEFCCPNCAPCIIKYQQLPIEKSLCCAHRYVLVNLENLYEEDLTAAICALANKNLGSIIIVKKHAKKQITEGLFSLTKQEANNIDRLIKLSLERIVHHEDIKVKLEPVFLKKRSKQQSLQFVLRLNISVLNNKRKDYFFHAQHKIKNFKATYQYYKLNENQNESLSLNKLIKQMSNDEISQGEIYKQMQYKADEIINKTNNPILSRMETTLLQLQYMISINLSTCISQISKEEKKEYKIVIDNQLLCRCCKIFNQSNFEKYFRPTTHNQSIILFSINLDYGMAEALRKTQKFFKNHKIKYEIIIPMEDFQNYLNKQRMKISQNYIPFMMCAVIFESKLKQSLYGLKESFGKQNTGYVIFQPISEKIQTAGYFNEIEIDYINSLAFNKFAIFPNISKILFTQQNNINLYRKVEFIFIKKDLNIALYLYMLLQLSKKRPKCSI